MPELPEVETIRRDLRKDICGLRIEEVRVLDRRVLGKADPAEFIRNLVGRKFRDVGRRGKALILDLEGLFLIVQPMMTGQLITSTLPGGVAVRDARVVFRLSKNRMLVYNDQRLFGRLTLVIKLDDLKHIRMLGPEPLERDFTVDSFRYSLRKRGVAIKTVLLDGKLVAGIGNIYASEALFLAKISPRRKACGLKRDEVARLWQAIRDVLALAIRLRGTSMRNYRDGRGEKGKYLQIIKVYGRDGAPCRSCGSVVQKIVQAQRSTFYCLRCQR